MKKFLLVLSFGLLKVLPVWAECDSENPCVWDCSSGAANSSCTATLENGTLTVSGNGDMKDYAEVWNNTDNIAPWANNNVQKLVVEQGITSIGRAAFENQRELQEVSLPDGLKKIENDAFNNCVILSNIKIPDSVTYLGSWVFNHTNLSEVEMPPQIKSLQQAIFASTPLINLVVPENVTFMSETVFKYYEDANNIALQNLYCPAHLATQCEKAVQKANVDATLINVQIYQKLDNGQFLVEGRFYQNLNDIYGDNHIKKRIYTVDEANTVTGQKNKVIIRYK